MKMLLKASWKILNMNKNLLSISVHSNFQVGEPVELWSEEKTSICSFPRTLGVFGIGLLLDNVSEVTLLSVSRPTFVVL